MYKILQFYVVNRQLEMFVLEKVDSRNYPQTGPDSLRSLTRLNGPTSNYFIDKTQHNVANTRATDRVILVGANVQEPAPLISALITAVISQIW